MKRLQQRPIDALKPDKNQPRKIFNDEHIKGLAQSLAVEGMINPVECDESGTIITGECRWRAAKLLGWKEIPVIVSHLKYNEYERLRHQMAENVHQSGSSYDTLMNPVDTARGYARLLKLKTGKDYLPGQTSRETIYGWVKELSEEIGVSYDTIYEHLKLLEEPSYVIEDITKGRPRTYYRAIEGLPEETKDKIKRKVARGDYKSREEITQDVRIIKKIPDATEGELARQKAKESAITNRILNKVAQLALALEELPLAEIDIREKGIVEKQLRWLKEKIDGYLSGNGVQNG